MYTKIPFPLLSQMRAVAKMCGKIGGDMESLDFGKREMTLSPGVGDWALGELAELGYQ